MNDEAVAALLSGLAFGPHQHAGAVDRHVAAGASEDLEDGCRFGGNDPIDFDPFCGHDTLLVTASAIDARDRPTERGNLVTIPGGRGPRIDRTNAIAVRARA